MLKPEVLAAFDRAMFEREGYWVWEGVLTELGRIQWVQSLRQLQAMNDVVVLATNWAAIDFARHGLVAPDPDTITFEALASYCGGSEQMRFQQPGLRDFMYKEGLFDRALATEGIDWQGMMPEYFPLAYDGFILDVATSHPQMMELLTKVLGAGFLLDHMLMLNRVAGSTGRRWHGHPYRQGQHETQDPTMGGTSSSTEFLQNQCVRTLCYPEGMGHTDGGGELSVVPGAHHYRTPYLWDQRRTEYDDDFAKGWLGDKVHAYTGEPLQIKRLDLPPGSMVSFVHHMPHHVAHRNADAPTRWGLLMAYRTRDPQEAPSQWNEGTPVHWAERELAAGRLTPEMMAVFVGDTSSTC